jgi:hypothetical protein
MRRVTFYIDDEEYRQLRIVLASERVSASEWLRGIIYTYVSSNAQKIRLPDIKNKHLYNQITKQPLTPENFTEEDLL